MADHRSITRQHVDTVEHRHHEAFHIFIFFGLFLPKDYIKIGLKNIYTVQLGHWCNNGTASSSSKKANSECYVIRMN